MAVYPKLNAILLRLFQLLKYYVLPFYDQFHTTYVPATVLHCICCECPDLIHPCPEFVSTGALISP